MFADFTFKLSILIEKEFLNNREQLGRFLTHPRISNNSQAQIKQIRDSSRKEALYPASTKTMINGQDYFSPERKNVKLIGKNLSDFQTMKAITSK